MGVDFSGADTHFADLATGVDNVHTFSTLTWAMATHATNSRLMYGKDDFSKGIQVGGAGFDNALVFRVNRATQGFFARSSTTITPNVPFCVCPTYDPTSLGQIYLRTLTTPFAEVAYESVMNGSGAESDDSANPWRWGNNQAANFGFRGIIYFAHHLDRRLTSTAEMDELAEEMILNPDTQFAVHMGLSGATAVDVGPSGFAITVSGATQATHIALPRKVLGGGFTPTGALARTPGISIAGSVAPSAALASVAVKSLAGLLLPSAILSLGTTRPLAGSLAPAGALDRTSDLSLSGTLTPSGAVSGVLTAVQATSGSIAPAGSLVLEPRRILGGVLAPAGALNRSVTRALSGTLALTGSLATTATRALAGALSLAASLLPTELGVALVARIRGALGVSSAVRGSVTAKPAVRGDVAVAPSVRGTLDIDSET